MEIKEPGWFENNILQRFNLRGRRRGRSIPTIAGDPNLKRKVTEFMQDSTVRITVNFHSDY